MRVMTRIAVLVSAFALLLFAVPVSASSEDSPQLFGTVGPGFTIVLADGAGDRVTNLAPGSYTVRVNDVSAGHNFHLYGPGVDQATDVIGTGTTSWTMQLQPGSYVFQCDIHVGEMSGGFNVGEASHPTTPPSTRPAQVGTLTASVTGRRVSLSAHEVRAGSYR